MKFLAAGGRVANSLIMKVPGLKSWMHMPRKVVTGLKRASLSSGLGVAGS